MEPLVYNLADGLEILQFVTLTSINIFATYNPAKTTLAQIHKSFLEHYSCKSIDNNLIAFKINDLIFNDLDQSLTMLNVYENYNIQNPNKIQKIIIALKSDIKSKNLPMTPEYKTKLLKSDEVIIVASLTGSRICYPILPNTTVLHIKELIRDKQELVIDQQRLIFAGKALEDDKLLTDYKIDHGSTIHLVLRLRGGMYHETSGKNGNFEPLQECFFSIDSDLE